MGIHRWLTLPLEEFVRGILEEEAHRHGASTDDVFTAAALYYLFDSPAGRLAARVPRLDRSGSAEGRARSVRAGTRLSADAWKALEAEAARQRVQLALLLEHVLLYYLADVQRGQLRRMSFVR